MRHASRAARRMTVVPSPALLHGNHAPAPAPAWCCLLLSPASCFGPDSLPLHRRVPAAAVDMLASATSAFPRGPLRRAAASGATTRRPVNAAVTEALCHRRRSQQYQLRRFFSPSPAAEERDVPHKAIVTVSMNGVFTDPKKFNIPVTPAEMATQAKEAFDAGATVAHIHFRNQHPDRGHEPSWDPAVATDIAAAIRAAAPELLLNFTTGTLGDKGPLGGGPLGPTGGPISCLEAGLPAIAALNSGSLNYLRTTKSGQWAWPPMMFENPVAKVETMVGAMKRLDIIPECECFDTGIVRSIGMFESVGILQRPYIVSLVMGVASGMPAKPEWLPLLLDELPPDSLWQVIAIGREEVWPLLRRAAELGGNVRTGLEDTFYLPDGTRAETNGQLVEALVQVLRETGREPASPAETRAILGLD